MQACKREFREAALSAPDLAMLDFAVKLTRTPSEMTEDDVKKLREQGFDDMAIHDIVQITALFNYYDRLADGLGVDPEPDFDSG